VAAYRINDVVTENGSSFIARAESTGVDPQFENTAWALFVARGETGAPGADGRNGVGAMVTNAPAGGTNPCTATGGVQITAGDGSISFVCNGAAGASGTTGQGATMALSSTALQASATATTIPGMTIRVPVTGATSAVILSSDGGLSSLSAIVGQFGIVDIFLVVDCPGTATNPPTTRTLSRRRIYAANVVDKQFAIGNWALSVIDVPPQPGEYVYRVMAALAGPGASTAPVVVAGNADSVLRGTLMAFAINK
jgi:hypothetical protein